MRSVAASPVSQQYTSQSSSNRSQRPTWRKTSSSTSIGINARKAGKLGKADNEVSSTFLQLTANPCSAVIAASAVNPRPPRFGHSQPQMYSIVCGATQRREAIVARHRALTHQHAKPWDRGDVLTALGWIASIALRLIALSELLGEETVRRKFLAEAEEE